MGSLNSPERPKFTWHRQDYKVNPTEKKKKKRSKVEQGNRGGKEEADRSP